VSTGLGSTSWMKSVLTGSFAIAQSMGADLSAARFSRVAWDAPYLNFAVREPFPSIATQATLVCGRTGPNAPLTIRSLMPENGVIFSDGIEQDFLNFNSGVMATIAVADKQGHLIV
jgi:hypothetical protein